MNISEVRKIVGGIKEQLFKNSNSYSIGMLKSHFRGTGLQFKEHQVYGHGDDIRFLDWKLLAKSQTPYIKTFEEERNVDITVVIDAGPSMMIGHQDTSKLQAAIEICCLLFLLAGETNDYVSVILVTDKIVRVRRSSGERGIVAFISELERADLIDENGKVKRNFNRAIHNNNLEVFSEIMKFLSRKRELVILSDFIDFLDSSLLKKLSANRHVHGFQIIAPIDEKDKVPYRLFSTNGSRLGTYEISGAGKKTIVPLKRFKKLKVHKRYLETFVKEML